MESSSLSGRPTGKTVPLSMDLTSYDPDREFLDIQQTPVINPVIAFHESLRAGRVQVEEAWLYEGRFDERGGLMKESSHLEFNDLIVPYRIRHVKGQEYNQALESAKNQFDLMPSKIDRLNEAKAKHLNAVESLKKETLLKEDFNTDQIQAPYDANQYTEYAPTYGGPFNKQLYIYDYLTMHARAFEAKNHNPLAKRIVDVLAQYAFGRRFKVIIKNEKQKKVWEEFEEKYKITHKISKFWSREYLTFGELMIDKARWDSIDPSTVWDIITNPDDIGEVYYYYQNYPTAYQTFTGYRIKGEPGSEKQSPLKYIIRQLPAHQVLHIKANVSSMEKRGRSFLFPILGWLKRVKDLYNAEVLKAQLEASFIWDDTIDGNAGDVAAHASQYSTMPKPASVFVHNKAVERKPMPAMTGTTRGSVGVSDEILGFIATSIGIPKEFFNVMGAGSGNRATAVQSAEPFEKVIEDLQADFEHLLHSVAEEVFELANVPYKKGDVEFGFPSVTKDTTTEAIKNISFSETMGYIDHQAASEMVAAEMNITTYDYKAVQAAIKKDSVNKSDPLMPPAGRFPAPPPSMNGDGDEPDGSPIRGNGARKLKAQLKTL